MRIESFEELDVWRLGREIKLNLLELVKAFPKAEEYRLKDQLLRAAISVTANIAEGFGRYHYKENIQYRRQARGSLHEIIDHLITACDFGYLDENTLIKMKSDIKRNIKVLNSYISMINRKKELNT